MTACDLSTGVVASASGRSSLESGQKSQEHPPQLNVKPALIRGSSHTLAARCSSREELLRIAQLLPREPLPLQVARRIAASNIVDDESSNASNSPENLSLRKQ
jgi:hypothetical protein